MNAGRLRATILERNCIFADRLGNPLLDASALAFKRTQGRIGFTVAHAIEIAAGERHEPHGRSGFDAERRFDDDGPAHGAQIDVAPIGGRDLIDLIHYFYAARKREENQACKEGHEEYPQYGMAQNR